MKEPRLPLRFGTVGSLLALCLAHSSSVDAQLRAEAVYELGASSTGLGPDDGSATFGYGFGLGATFTLRMDRPVDLVAGGELLVRGFGVDVPGRLTEGVGVFRQADLYIDQFIALRARAVEAGLYLEQRRIERGVAAGTLGFPTSGVGLVGRVSAGPEGRFELRLSYASVLSGKLRLGGLSEEPEVESGHSIRASVGYRLTPRFAVRGEYSDSALRLETGTGVRSFFDHRQRGFHVGLVLTLTGRTPGGEAETSEHGAS